MITCTLGDKKYTVDFIKGRVLREITPALEMYTKIAAMSEAVVKGQEPDTDKSFTIPEAMDTLVKWFCLLFDNQFTPDEVYDNYPSDRLMHDIVLALMAVQSQTTNVLESFPTTAAEDENKGSA